MVVPQVAKIQTLLRMQSAPPIRFAIQNRERSKRLQRIPHLLNNFDRNAVGSTDPFRDSEQRAIEALAKNPTFTEQIEAGRIPWGLVIGMLKDSLPPTLSDRDSIAYNLVPRAMNEILGPQDKGWTTERKGAKSTLFIVNLRT